MKISIGKKLGILVGILLTLFLILGVVAYVQVRKIDKSLVKIAEIEGPLSQAAYEMEINLLGTGFGILGYLRDRGGGHLGDIKGEVAGFDVYQEKYRDLADKEKGEALAALGTRYTEFKNVANEIVSIENEQTQKIEDLLGKFEEMDSVLDKKIRMPLSTGDPQGHKKLQTIVKMGTFTNGMAKDMVYYLRTREQEHLDRINKDMEDFRNTLTDYQRFRLSTKEKEWAKQIEDTYISSTNVAKAIVGFEKKKEQSLAKFVELRKEMDAVLGGKVQAATQADVESAKAKGRKTVHTAAIVILVLLLAGGVFGFVASTVITQSITGPVKKLKHASVEFGKGNLDTQIDAKSDDEIGELAVSFSRMAGEIKQLLEKERELTARAEVAAQKERDKSEELDKAYSELRKTHEELKNTQAVLIQTEKLSALGDLGAGVAHEMNNPLTGVVGLVKTYMKEKNKDSEEYKDLVTIKTACEHMVRIVKDFTDFTRYSSEDMIGLSCNDVVESVMSFSTHILEKRNIKIEKHYDPNLPTITGNKNQLQQVVMNMVTNAKDAMEGKGVFSITTRAVESDKRLFAEMEFKDTGCGISKENMDKLFDPFFTTKRPGKGVGLGLSISHTIIKAHHGEILVASEPGKGTTFTIRFPAERHSLD